MTVEIAQAISGTLKENHTQVPLISDVNAELQAATYFQSRVFYRLNLGYVVCKEEFYCSHY